MFASVGSGVAGATIWITSPELNVTALEKVNVAVEPDAGNVNDPMGASLRVTAKVEDAVAATVAVAKLPVSNSGHANDLGHRNE